MQNNQNIISIIIPVYNVELFVSKCLESVIQQDYKNIEIIVINDGSTDDSLAICERYKNKDKRITLINQSNHGLSFSRNIGIERAKGEWIIFLDSDDWISNDFCTKLLNLALMHQSDLVISNYVKVYEGSLPIINSKTTLLIFEKNEALNELYNEKYLQFVISCGKLIRRTILNSIRFPNGKLHEDEFVSHLILSNSNRVVYTSEQLLFYRQRPNSITNQKKSAKNYLDSIEAHNIRASYFNSINSSRLFILTTERLFLITYNFLNKIKLSKLIYRRTIYVLKKSYLILAKSNVGFYQKVKYTLLYYSLIIRLKILDTTLC